jgi:hypothetical protein
MKEFISKPAGIKLEKFVIEKDLVSTAKLYAEVFAGPPWNEYTKCMGCNDFFGLESKPKFPCNNCGKELTLAYPTDETEQHIVNEISRKNASIFVMKKQDSLIGFVWGFSYQSSDDFVIEKYLKPQMQKEIILLLGRNGIADEFFYFSECGIKTDQRGNKLSNILSEALIKEAQKTGLSIVLRTNYASPMVAVAERFGMTQIMGPRVEIDKTNMKILAGNESVINFTDSEIEERVLFMLQYKHEKY